MSNKGLRKCAGCEKFFDFTSDGWFADRGEYIDKPICQECWHNDDPDIATIVEYDGDKNEISLGNYTLMGDTDNISLAVEDLANSIKWVKSDGWRGHYTGDTPKGYVRVVDAWFSLDGIHGDSEGLIDRLEYSLSAGDYPPFPVIVASLRTSNCMSRGLDVYVQDKDQLLKWMGDK